jgi:GT2 family glycosyltransferase
MPKSASLLARLVTGRKPTPLELLQNTELFDPAWYRESHADLRGRPLDAARHYLEHGASEGRNPHPNFDTRWYLRQNPDVAASGMNPLVHFVLHGQKEGRLPRPPHSSGESANLSKLRLLATSSAVRGATAATSAEPRIKPPPLVGTNKLTTTEIRRRNAQIFAAVRNLQGAGNRPDIDSFATNGLEGEAFASIKLPFPGPAEAPPSAVFNDEKLFHTGNPMEQRNSIIGLGITPERIITEDDVPDYDTPVLRRYNAGRLDAARRFELDPSRASSITSAVTISLLVPVYRTPIVFLERAILSVLFQTYANWELILMDDYSQRSDVEAVLKYYGSVDSRVKVQFRTKNGGISAASNGALAAATGTYVGLLDHDDMLTCDALEKVAERLNENPDLDFVYTDECKIDDDNVPDDLFHKPDWSPLLLLNFMYTGHFSVYRKSLVESVGGFRSKYDLSQDYDLALRVAERRPKVSHVDECLYGWRMIPGSGASGDRPNARISNVAALQDAADRRGYDGVALPLPTANRVKRDLSGRRPIVSIVIPSDNQANIRTSIDSIIAHSSYSNYEILVVTSSKLIASAGNQFGAVTRFVAYDQPYNFSDKCNAGASHARGEYVVFYNDDVRVISPDWIESLLEYLTLPEVGAVSPKLLYENGTIQYAGLVTGVRRLIGTAFHAYPENTTAYFNLAQSVREVSILTGACLAMPMNVFREIEGFDKDNTPVAHSDVDICFRLRETGRRCVYTPHAQLTHIGHLSIGSVEAENEIKAKPFQKNKADLYLLKEWGRYLEEDPYFPGKLKDLVYIDSQEPFSFRKGISQPRTKAGKDFILFSHDLSASGAPRCLYEAAKVLIEEGHYVLVISPEDGPFRQRFIKIGADVVVDPLALSGHETVVDLAKNFDVAICNTIVCWPVPGHLAPYLPVYLHSHETDLVRHLRDSVPGFCDGLAAATAIWAEGPISASKIRDYCGLEALSIEPCVEEMPDLPIANDDYRGEIVVALIGTYEPRKGQDIAVDAFKRLPCELQSMFRLVMAGRTNDAKFRAEIEKRAKGHSNIVFFDQLGYAEVVKLLRRADIVLVPSRDDAGPTTAIDALGAGKILIASATSGISRYLVDGKSGFILYDNSAEDICGTLCRAFDQKRRWSEVGARAREIYEAHFTRQRFKEQLLNALGLLQ